MFQNGPRLLRLLLIIAVVCAALDTILTIPRSSNLDSIAERHELILVYYEPDPPFPALWPGKKPVLQYPSLWNGDPSRIISHDEPFLGFIVYRCGARHFEYRFYNGSEATGWSNSVSKEVIRVPLQNLPTNVANCLMGLVDPPHIRAALPMIESVEPVIRKMVRYDPPLF